MTILQVWDRNTWNNNHLNGLSQREDGILTKSSQWLHPIWLKRSWKGNLVMMSIFKVWQTMVRMRPNKFRIMVNTDRPTILCMAMKCLTHGVRLCPRCPWSMGQWCLTTLCQTHNMSMVSMAPTTHLNLVLKQQITKKTKNSQRVLNGHQLFMVWQVSLCWEDLLDF